MKKYVVVFMMAMALFVTGCGNEKTDKPSEQGDQNTPKESVLTCTPKDTDSNEVLKVTHRGDKVLTITSSESMEEDKETIDATYDLLKNAYDELNKIDGFQIDITKESDTSLKMTMTIDYEKLDTKALEDQMGADAADFAAGKDLSIKEFQEQVLDDYTCK